MPDWSELKPGELIDLAAVENGGVPLACSDMFFSSMNNLVMPGRSANMGDGWETKRRRGPGHDWIILKLGLPGAIEKIEVDTNHFKGNYLDTCSIDAFGCTLPAPFVSLSFLTLSPIPALKLTDQGLVDAVEMKLISLFAD